MTIPPSVVWVKIESAVAGFKIRVLEGVLEHGRSDSTLDDGSLLGLVFLVGQIWIGVVLCFAWASQEGAFWKQVDTTEMAVFRVRFGLGSWKSISKTCLRTMGSGSGAYLRWTLFMGWLHIRGWFTSSMAYDWKETAYYV